MTENIPDTKIPDTINEIRHTPHTHVNELIDYMLKTRKEVLASKIKRYPKTCQTASSIGDCDRQIVHSVLDWDKAIMHNEWVQAMFDRGNSEEAQVTKDLLDMNLKVIEMQTPFEIKARDGSMICRGKIDGKLIYNGRKYPFELKTMNVNSFNSINSLDDMTKNALHRKYLRQIQLYLYGHEQEEGLFILTDLQGHYKLIPVYLDYGECEFILKRIESNAIHIKNKTYPDKITFNPKICERCAFNHICLPDNMTEGVTMIDDGELEAQLTRRAELKVKRDEYETLDEQIKARFRDVKDVIIGTAWRIFSTHRKGKRVDTKSMPADVKKPYEVETETVIVSIVSLDKDKKTQDVD